MSDKIKKYNDFKNIISQAKSFTSQIPDAVNGIDVRIERFSFEIKTPTGSSSYLHCPEKLRFAIAKVLEEKQESILRLAFNELNKELKKLGAEARNDATKILSEIKDMENEIE